ncbi:TIGR03619 family F420-dependent LLM class oxidoreductase [Microbacterium sp. No. 7]|uniref:TIGR03619 family F420-dependent LLM class oxidoreductase n=1 Tax=Microbacterium sp. No. 7 TaxID=1714373 RepID=UPI0006ECF058|nr:TIGR03619 family F420-dependent LLM class oxidoreductase [Microbacterium sp. No. 7]ALJ18844.1 hypothetical protein AOA12_02525 [Microbacterium sp. No. 7]
MRFSLTMPNNTRVRALAQPWELGVGPDQIVVAARQAEALGFHRITVGEHLTIPASHVEASGSHYMHATTALGFLAGATSRIRIGSNVTLLALQHPIVQAKQWAVLDWLSGGRADCLIGVGWLEDEFDALGVDFHRRGRLTDEHVEAMIEIWTRPVAGFAGASVRFDGVTSEPKPVQRPHVPLGFAGDTDATVRRMARWGTTWSPFQTPPEQIPRRLDEIRSHPQYHGRPVDVFLSMSTLKIADGHRPKPTGLDFDTWDADEFGDIIGWLAGLGVTEVAPTIPAVRDFSHYLDRLAWISEEIMPRFPDPPAEESR